MNLKDFGTGVVFAAAALAFGGRAYAVLPIGTTRSMGPGFFPIATAILLFGIGAVLIGRSLAGGPTLEAYIRPNMRAVVMIAGAMVAFWLTLEHVGMLPAVFLSCLLATFAYPAIPLLTALTISAAVAVFCVIVFIGGVGLPVPVLDVRF